MTFTQTGDLPFVLLSSGSFAQQNLCGIH